MPVGVDGTTRQRVFCTAAMHAGECNSPPWIRADVLVLVFFVLFLTCFCFLLLMFRSFRGYCPNPIVFFSVSAMVCASAAILFLLFGSELAFALPGSGQAILGPATQSIETPVWPKPPAQKGKWNHLYHQGGNGPWIQKIDGVVDGGIDVPEGCKIDMVHGVCLDPSQ